MSRLSGGKCHQPTGRSDASFVIKSTPQTLPSEPCSISPKCPMAQKSQIAPEALPEDSIPSTSTSNAPQGAFSSTGKLYSVLACNLGSKIDRVGRQDRGTRAEAVRQKTDAWVDVNAQSVIYFIATTPTPIFYEAVYTRESRHTAAYLSNTTADIINRIGAGKVLQLWLIMIHRTLLRGITWLNLLAKDITGLEAYTSVVMPSR